eukprot:UN16607
MQIFKGRYFSTYFPSALHNRPGYLATYELKEKTDFTVETSSLNLLTYMHVFMIEKYAPKAQPWKILETTVSKISGNVSGKFRK